MLSVVVPYCNTMDERGLIELGQLSKPLVQLKSAVASIASFDGTCIANVYKTYK